MARPPQGLYIQINRLKQTIRDFTEAEAILIEATAEALRQIDKIPPEDRTTHGIASYLVTFGEGHAADQASGEATRIRHLLGQLIQHMPELDWPDDFQSYVDSSDS